MMKNLCQQWEKLRTCFHRKNNHLTTMRTACEAIEAREETKDRRFLWKFLESEQRKMEKSARENFFLQRNLLIRFSERIDEQWACG